MKIVFDSEFVKALKKLDVRTRKSFKKQILLFSKDPNNPYLDNHPLRGNYSGYRSIDITSDYRALFKEVNESGDVISYFIAIGTHSQLYKL